MTTFAQKLRQDTRLSCRLKRMTQLLREGLATSTGLLLLGGAYVSAQAQIDVPGGTQGYANVLAGGKGPDGAGSTSHPQGGGQGLNPGSLAVTLTGALSGNAGGSTPPRSRVHPASAARS
jgi:hypothetical protein